MTLLGRLVQLLFCPGLLAALGVGLLARSVSLWLGARLGRRPARPFWQPLADIVHLAGREPVAGPGGRPALVAAAGLLAVVATAWATGMLPWPRWPWAGEALPGGLLAYLVLLAVPPLVRLLAAGFSDSPAAALGVRRLGPLELARLLPLMVAGAALPLFTGQLGLVYAGPLTPWSALVGLAIVAMLLATLPWALWDRDEGNGLLAAVGGRLLTLFRVVELLELAAQIGLVAVALRATGLYPEYDVLALPLAWLGAVVALSLFEAGGRRVLVPEVAQRYTRWVFPIAVAVAVLGWWLGKT